MTESSAVPVRDVLLWLSRVDADEASRLLVGCALNDGTGDEAVPIVALDAERKAVTLEGGRRLLLAGARDGEIVETQPDAPLASAIAARWTPDERRERQERAELEQAGIDADQLASGDDRRAVLAVLRAMAAGTLPDPEHRHRFHAALSTAAEPRLARTGAHLLAQLAEQFRSAGTIPDDLYWHRTWLLRTAGQLRDAVSVSDALHLGLVKDQDARKRLATIRAAVLLDLFEATGEVKWLGLADRAARVAQAIAPTEEEVKAVNRRLETARAQAARGA